MTGEIAGNSGGFFTMDGNVFIKAHGYDGWLTTYLDLRPKIYFEGVVHENSNVNLETNSMYLFISTLDISNEWYHPYVALLYTGVKTVNRLDIAGETSAWSALPTSGMIQGLYPVSGAYNHVVIIKLYPL